MISNIARCRPTSRASFCVPPPPGRIPTFTSGKPSFAPSPATMMSAHKASSRPPPSANPSTAAITGLGQSMIARQYFCTFRDMTSTGPASAISPMSAPAANATSDPVTITQRTLLSAPQRVISSASRTRTSRLSALRTCGRLILNTTISSVGCSTRSDSGAAMAINPRFGRNSRKCTTAAIWRPGLRQQAHRRHRLRLHCASRECDGRSGQYCRALAPE